MSGTELAESPYTLKRVQELLGIQSTTVRSMVSKGFVNPTRGPRRELRFSFQDLLVLKTAEGLRRANVPQRRIVASLATLRANLPTELPLSGLRIVSAGADVVVQDAAGGMREATTGQLVLDFEVQLGANSTLVLADRTLAEKLIPTTDWFELGEELESSDLVRAEDAYRRAISESPGRVDALVNLGALLCESGRSGEAVDLYEYAVASGVASALLHFNQAIALEDVGSVDLAIDAYKSSLRLDPRMADSHYNLGMLLDGRGDGKGAVRHFSAYRRLTKRNEQDAR